MDSIKVQQTRKEDIEFDAAYYKQIQIGHIQSDL